ncbi:sigma 54-interacting transcriptional regulator [Athalassotoga saccharophila]|uniref:sigma 54-interacting transcriptional regulator n=1 Tax=Athalassotoga saccharophila TaxID=1441386 RepID=UPI00137A5F7D|nr:sigma 54-interacting transcriptional regulator [Athalassotoga saccharophila]BBJ28682.1 regulatory protein LuxO [Athalassotoga saccharophila]
MDKIKIFYVKCDCEDDKPVEELINVILKNKPDIEGKVEFCPVDEFPSKFDKNDIVIVKESNDEKDKIMNKIYLVDGELNERAVVNAQQRSYVYAIFDVKRFYGERKEYSEMARFEDVLKRLVRDKLSTRFLESEMSKPVNWKIDLSNYSKEKFISMFSDENMRSVIFKANRIVESLKSTAKQFQKFRKDVKSAIDELKKLENSNTQELSKVQKIFGEINNKSKELSIGKLPSILITGPTGSGKTLFAKYIARKFLENDFEDHFAKVTLVNISETIVDSELFGTFPGSFTGSLYKMGKFLSNTGGVIFLDEIGEISEKIQAKLLTYLDDMKVTIDGYSDPRGLKVPVMIIAATNKDIKKEIETGNFRRDLFERFDYSIRIPSLKERKSDFRYILSFVLQDQLTSLQKEKEIKRISLKAIEKLERYDYPGNFRELESLVKEAIMNAYIDGRDCILEKDFEIV